MTKAMLRARDEAIERMAFGDPLPGGHPQLPGRQASERPGSGLCSRSCVDSRPTSSPRQMIAGGLRARLTCIDPKVLSRDFAGREFDRALLDALPAGVDPCGERGEFHTFAFDGPIFRAPVAVRTGDVVERDGFVFADLLPAGSL